MLNLWGEEEELPEPQGLVVTTRKDAGNPLVTRYGPGPDGALCRECSHFLRLHYHDRNYSKCDLRKLTHGAGSDHRSRWPACAKFVAGESQSVNIDMMRSE